jgi:hypothetical protein
MRLPVHFLWPLFIFLYDLVGYAGAMWQVEETLGRLSLRHGSDFACSAATWTAFLGLRSRSGLIRSRYGKGLFCILRALLLVCFGLGGFCLCFPCNVVPPFGRTRSSYDPSWSGGSHTVPSVTVRARGLRAPSVGFRSNGTDQGNRSFLRGTGQLRLITCICLWEFARVGGCDRSVLRFAVLLSHFLSLFPFLRHVRYTHGIGIHHGQAGGPRRLGCLTTDEITKITITLGWAALLTLLPMNDLHGFWRVGFVVLLLLERRLEKGLC